MNIKDLLNGTQGELKSERLTDFSGVITDSRLEAEDKIFFALIGDVHDAHKFIPDLIKKGVGAIVSHQWTPELESLASQTTWIQVGDTLKALQNFSNYWRKKWAKPVIAITGSNGKTSVKDFTTTILSQKFNILKSHGSFNNHWGVPLTLLNLREEHDVAVVEMGMNRQGEILTLCQIAEPDMAMVNNVGRAHTGFFKSLDGVAAAKEEIYHGLKPQGTAVFNMADSRVKAMAERWKAKISNSFTFGTQDCDVYFRLDKMTAGGLDISGHIDGVESKTQAVLWGEHNVANLMAAATLALASGMKPKDIWQALDKCQTSWGRNQWLELETGQKLLFDGYNANPDSFKALLESLKQFPQSHRIIAVFGEMREQGENTEEVHRELGAAVANSPIASCLFIGPSQEAFQSGFQSSGGDLKNLIISDTYEDSLALKIKSMLDTDTLVVIKGSRGGALERVVRALDAINFENK